MIRVCACVAFVVFWDAALIGAVAETWRMAQPGIDPGEVKAWCITLAIFSTAVLALMFYPEPPRPSAQPRVSCRQRAQARAARSRSRRTAAR